MVSQVVNQTRQNHAVEHATVAALLKGGARPPLGGCSTPGGFLVYARESAESVASAVDEGLRRLREGEHEAAVSPYCGTNLAVGVLCAGLASGIILRGSKKRFHRVPLAIVAGIGAALLSRGLGEEVQRRFTTLADVGDLQISGVRSLQIGKHTVHWVGTSRASQRCC